MKGFVRDIEDIAVQNRHFRQVLYTARNGLSRIPRLSLYSP